jgi:hypothetical protein
MRTTIEDIISWFEAGKIRGCGYMIIACDTFSYENYPVYTTNDPVEFWKIYKNHDGIGMQKIVEVYDLSKDMGTQTRPDITVMNCPPKPVNPEAKTHVILEYNNAGNIIASHSGDSKVVKKIIAWGRQDGTFIKAEEKDSHLEKDKYNIAFYGDI